jgi:lipid-binding SYLF domain-containing protein
MSAAESIESVQDRNSVVSAIHSFQEMPVLEPYFRSSYGFAIFPTIGKGGMGIGGAHGRGWVFGGGKLTGQSTMTQVTIGFQLGGQAFSQIIFFEDKAAFDTFTRGNFELGAQASAVALTAGASAQAETSGGVSAGAGTSQAKRDYTNGIAIFTKAKGGLMYEASVGGQKFTYRPMGE